ncbi:hypothetical protein LXL04_023764 [Taraxacum kok-saghyz]
MNGGIRYTCIGGIGCRHGQVAEMMAAVVARWFSQSWLFFWAGGCLKGIQRLRKRGHRRASRWMMWRRYFGGGRCGGFLFGDGNLLRFVSHQQPEKFRHTMNLSRLSETDPNGFTGKLNFFTDRYGEAKVRDDAHLIEDGRSATEYDKFTII